MIEDELTETKQPFTTRKVCDWCGKERMLFNQERQWFSEDKQRATTYKWLSCPNCFTVIDLGIKTEDYKK